MKPDSKSSPNRIRVCSHQPSLFPWAGYWLKVADSNRIIMSSGVQFNYGGYQNRVQLQDFWWTLPIVNEDKMKPIKDVRIAPNAMKKYILQGRNAFAGKKWPYRDLVQNLFDTFEIAVDQNDNFMNAALSSHQLVSHSLGLWATVTVDNAGTSQHFTKTQNLFRRLKPFMQLSDVDYLAGSGALAYLKETEIPQGCRVFVQDSIVAPPTSIVQALALHGPDALKKVSCSWKPYNVKGSLLLPLTQTTQNLE